MQELFTKFDIDFILQFLKECDFYNKIRYKTWKWSPFIYSRRRYMAEMA